jgi:hypothetical protein
VRLCAVTQRWREAAAGCCVRAHFYFSFSLTFDIFLFIAVNLLIPNIPVRTPVGTQIIPIMVNQFEFDKLTIDIPAIVNATEDRKYDNKVLSFAKLVLSIARLSLSINSFDLYFE